MTGVSTAMVVLNNQNAIENNFVRALMECSSELQEQVFLLLKEVVCAEDVDPDDKEMAMFTIEDEAAQKSQELSAIVRQMDSQEVTFAQKLKDTMDEQGMTQSELAYEVGLGQSAIANLLARNCRPQRRTVVKLAKALNITPDELWPCAQDS